MSILIYYFSLFFASFPLEILLKIIISMLYLFKLLFLLININQETLLNWLGIENPINIFAEIDNYGSQENLSNLTSSISTDISVETIRIVTDALWIKLQTGLGLDDIEAVLFFIAFTRFIILAFRHNLKTSFYITIIGIIASYLWYRQFIEISNVYREILFRMPITRTLGMEILRLSHMKTINTDPLRWSNPIGIIWHGFRNGAVTDEGISLIDPISMIFANVPEPLKESTDQIYYLIFRDYGPLVIKSFKRLANASASMAAYTLITRIGKKYCPYLVRWHWTVIVMSNFVERFVIGFVARANSYVFLVLLPQVKQGLPIGSTVGMELELLNVAIMSIVLSHLSFILFGLLHALCGQYFYFPFIIENAELHIGKRPKTLYSGGYTAWQDRDIANIGRGLIPWYGWFGRGVGKNKWGIGNVIKNSTKKLFKKFRRLFRN